MQFHLYFEGIGIDWEHRGSLPNIINGYSSVSILTVFDNISRNITIISKRLGLRIFAVQS